MRDFGSVIVGKLLDSGRLRSIPDLYGLKPEELAEYERMGDTLARKILRNLEAKSEVSLARFVAGFDIEGIGELITEKAIAAGFDSLEKLRGAKIEELAVVDGLGEITARSIIQGLSVAREARWTSSWPAERCEYCRPTSRAPSPARVSASRGSCRR